jgi:DNA-directed RNA polymerase subunit beta'
VQHEKGHLVAVSRSGEIGMVDEHGRERERYKVPYGAVISVKDGMTRSRPARPSRPGIRTPIRSSPKWRLPEVQDFVDGLTSTEQVDDLTGLSRSWSGSEARGGGKDLRPTVKLLERKKGKEVQRSGYRHPGALLPAPGASCQPADGARVGSATSSRVSRRNPRRPATSPAVCRASPTCSRRASRRTGDPRRVSGTVSFGKETKGKRA